MPEIKVYDNSTDSQRVFRSQESAIEYCKARPHERFRIIVTGPSSMENIMRDIRNKLSQNLNNASIT